MIFNMFYLCPNVFAKKSFFPYFFKIAFLCAPKGDGSSVLFGLQVDSIEMFCINVLVYFSALSQCELSALITIVQLSMLIKI